MVENNPFDAGNQSAENELAEALQFQENLDKVGAGGNDSNVAVTAFLSETGMARLLELAASSQRTPETSITLRPEFEGILEQRILKLAESVRQSEKLRPTPVLTKLPSRLSRHRVLLAVAAMLVVALIGPLLLSILDPTHYDPNFEYASGTSNSPLPLLPPLGASIASAAGFGPDMPSGTAQSNFLGKIKFNTAKAVQNLNMPDALQGVPTQAPVYHQQVRPWPVAEARQVAGNLNFDPNSLQEDTTRDAYIFTATDGKILLLSRSVRGLWSYNARPDGGVISPGQSGGLAEAPETAARIDFNRARDLASTFLHQAGIFDASTNLQMIPYVGMAGEPSATSFQSVRLIQTVDGWPVYGAAAEVGIDGNGQILLVSSDLLPLEKGSVYPLVPRKDALKSLAERKLPLYQGDFYMDKQAGSGQVVAGVSKTLYAPKVTLPPDPRPVGPVLKPGDSVETQGRLIAFITHDPSGAQLDQYTGWLSAAIGRTAYTFYISGPKARQFDNLNNYRVTFKGKVTSVVPHQPDPLGFDVASYNLELESAQKDPPDQDRLDFLGKMTITKINGKDYKVLDDANGQRYISPISPAITPELYQEELQQEKNQLAQLPPDWLTAADIQLTGETVEGLRVVDIYATNSNATVKRGDQGHGSSTRNGTLPIANLSQPVVPNGTEISVNLVNLAYYQTSILNLPRGVNTSPEDLLVQPVYVFGADYSTDNGQTHGNLQLYAPAVLPEYLAK